MAEELAAEYGLELVEWRNFHDYVHHKLGAPEGGSKPGWEQTQVFEVQSLELRT